MDKIDPGPGYRLLEPWESWPNNTEVWCADRTWRLYLTYNPHRDPAYGYPRAARVPVTTADDEVQELMDIEPQTPNVPKPFTPNKYTRYIPTLDGRLVPVDVYCVSEAFSLGPCLKSGGALDAVNHARKKLLAPGQRGQKDALQDIKEAHASLGRAIALEEAALGREVQG